MATPPDEKARAPLTDTLVCTHCGLLLRNHMFIKHPERGICPECAGPIVFTAGAPDDAPAPAQPTEPARDLYAEGKALGREIAERMAPMLAPAEPVGDGREPCAFCLGTGQLLARPTVDGCHTFTRERLDAHDARIRAEAESATIAAVVAWLYSRAMGFQNLGHETNSRILRGAANDLKVADWRKHIPGHSRWRPTPGKERT